MDMLELRGIDKLYRSRGKVPVHAVRALDMAVEDKTVDAQAEIHRLMGDTYIDMGDNAQAREALTQSADLYDQLGSEARATEIRERMPTA